MPRLTELNFVSRVRRHIKHPYQHKRQKILATGDDVKQVNEISEKQIKKGRPCLRELTDMLDCWKLHDFSDSPCQKVIFAYSDCIKVEKARLKEEEKAAKASFVPEGRKPSPFQINRLLKRYS
ncbi:coiled-coil-helix-coiled-coil-helix domain-containing protein 1 [Lingula anatina]|uniref:Coiled-coil-helix-coiled-coil-helix domain-containing protein 1 n=1 Tax=Lingula anatina TaxID=7574 RepID=A0A1S3I655_LINAN|nr:coiled-coil-helix-coiled-coil-helix domain-containing protein 1 [Lingula anatina]|eukprot:XP_013393326.1 coiled-coil-helix-coiled-coil-helix domain-containing protein 1 [Lingula anatina]